MLKERHRFFVSMLFVLDTVVLGSAFYLSYLISSGSELSTGLDRAATIHAQRDAITFALMSIPILLAGMAGCGLYRPRRDRSFNSEFLDIVKASLIGWVAAFTAQHFLLPAIDSRPGGSIFLVAVPIANIACLTLHRFTFRTALRRMRERGFNRRHMAVIGTGRLGQIAFHTFTRNGWTGINCAYFISHHDTTRRRTCLERPVFSGLDHLEQTLADHPVDGVIIALPQSRSYLLPTVLMTLSRFAVEVRIIPDVSPRYMPVNLAVSELEGMPVLSVRQSPLNGFGAVAKRCLDLMVGSIALIFFSPIMLAIAAAIRISDGGPVFFGQTRASMGGKPFRIFKFRTMRYDPKGRADDGGGPDDEPRGKGQWTHRDDPRITPIGAFLRRFSMDELPQLFNVIRGDMSLVGPRPERVDLIGHFREDWRGYMLRQNVKAGMTGWAQINGLRGDTSLRKRLQYDMYYIRNWSIFFDLRILALTLFRGFRNPNAH